MSRRSNVSTRDVVTCLRLSLPKERTATESTMSNDMSCSEKGDHKLQDAFSPVCDGAEDVSRLCE